MQRTEDEDDSGCERRRTRVWWRTVRGADNRDYKSGRGDVVRSGGPVIRGNMVGMIWRRAMEVWVGDVGIGCETMWCVRMIVRYEERCRRRGRSDEKSSNELPCRGRGTAS